MRIRPRLSSQASSAWLPLALVAAWSCTPTVPERPTLSIHYLGHSSFVLTFADTLTVLTDYGESEAYGLDSPIYSTGSLEPGLITYSHLHPDHAGGPLPTGAGYRRLSGEEILARGPFQADPSGQSEFSPRPGPPLGTWPKDPLVVLRTGGLVVTALPGHEGGFPGPPDNVGFLFEYGGWKVLHLGDCQGLIDALAGEQKNRGGPTGGEAVISRIRTLYPGHYDVVLLPIGFTSDILEKAAEFAALLDADIIVPMHFWTPGDRDRFLSIMQGRLNRLGRIHEAHRGSGAKVEPYSTSQAHRDGPVMVLGLVPEAWDG